MSYIHDELPIPKEYEQWHQNTIKHYNFTKTGEQTGICSHCGTGLNSSATRCNLCGCELIPRRVTKAFNHKSKAYYQETACERIHKFKNKVLYSYYIAWTEIAPNLQETSNVLEVERQFVNDPYPNTDKRIKLCTARFYVGDKWHVDCKYSDYYFGNGQKKHRKIYNMIPENYREFLSDTEAKYTCLGEFLESKYNEDSKPYPTYFLDMYWASLNWSYNELLWKSGFKKLYEAILIGYDLDRRKISKNIMKSMRKDLMTIGDPTVDEFMILREVHTNKLDFKVTEIKGLTLNMVELLPKAMELTGASQSKCWRYMKEVCVGDCEETCGRYGGRTHAHVRQSWIDYLEMVREIEGNIEGKKAFPENPQKAHDDILRIKNALRNEQRAREQIEQANELTEMMAQTIKEYNLEKLEYTDPKSGLMIVAMKSVKDIVDEGALMNHCVGGIGYIEGMAHGKSFIFSMRKIEEPNVPVGTIQYKIGQGVVQCQGYDNKENSLPTGYQETLEHWQQHIREVAA
jgi:hypothetical protein